MDAAVVLQQLRVAKFLDACVVQRWVKLISYMVCRIWGCTWHSSAILLSTCISSYPHGCILTVLFAEKV